MFFFICLFIYLLFFGVFRKQLSQLLVSFTGFEFPPPKKGFDIVLVEANSFFKELIGNKSAEVFHLYVFQRLCRLVKDLDFLYDAIITYMHVTVKILNIGTCMCEQTV